MVTNTTIRHANNRLARLFTSVLAIMTLPAAATPGPSGYQVVTKFILGGEAHWDFITIDPTNRRLYVTHGQKVEVIDADNGKKIGVVENTPGVHGVALAPELGKGFTTNGSADTVSVFDLHTLRHIAEIKAGKNPDATIYDSNLHRVFISNADSDDMTVIDAATGHVVGTVSLGGTPEYVTSDNRGMVWVNLEDKDAVVALNGKTLKIEKTAPLPGCKGPSSMAIDIAHRRLFIGCANRTLKVVNPDTGTIVSSLPIGEHVDATSFDPESGFIFASTGDGRVTVIRQNSPDQYNILDTIETMRGAKTMVLDPATKKLFLPTVEGVPSTATGPPRSSGPGFYKPGQFLVVVVEKQQKVAQQDSSSEITLEMLGSLKQHVCLWSPKWAVGALVCEEHAPSVTLRNVTLGFVLLVLLAPHAIAQRADTNISSSQLRRRWRKPKPTSRPAACWLPLSLP
jgi:YVTN family beta-propeller protein